jgi:nucleotide-binding universal stress UspA family protein
MTTFKNILIPVDFSAQSNAALRLGSELAARFQSSITLLHVYELLPYGLPSDYEMYAPDLRQRVAARIEEELLAAKRRAEAAGAASIETKAIEGYPAADIAKFAARGRFDLIVMGTHGRRGVQHALLGSVAERVVRTAPCPVLTVRAPEEAAGEAPKVWPLAASK